MNPKPQIFLSYARLDKEIVTWLYQRLSETGFNPWMDEEDIVVGEPWEYAIKAAIKQSDFFVACLSANSINRRGMIEKEIKQALNIYQGMMSTDIYLIPARLEECDVPGALKEFQWVDLFNTDGFERLVQGIRTGLERRGIPISKSSDNQPSVLNPVEPSSFIEVSITKIRAYLVRQPNGRATREVLANVLSPLFSNNLIQSSEFLDKLENLGYLSVQTANRLELTPKSFRIMERK